MVATVSVLLLVAAMGALFASHTARALSIRGQGTALKAMRRKEAVLLELFVMSR